MSMASLSPAPVPAEPPAAPLERARQLCLSAQALVAEATAQVADSKRRKIERAHWRDLWQSRCVNPDYVVICCAYCARVRDLSEQWGPIPIYVSQGLHLSSSPVRLSHGICPDCLSRHFPRNLIARDR
jgi:hypothetical protein